MFAPLFGKIHYLSHDEFYCKGILDRLVILGMLIRSNLQYLRTLGIINLLLHSVHKVPTLCNRCLHSFHRYSTIKNLHRLAFEEASLRGCVVLELIWLHFPDQVNA